MRATHTVMQSGITMLVATVIEGGKEGNFPPPQNVMITLESGRS